MTNISFKIQAAERGGYVVLGSRTREMFDDNVDASIILAGNLKDCLAFIEQEIIKHDNWRAVPELGPGQIVETILDGQNKMYRTEESISELGKNYNSMKNYKSKDLGE